MKLRFSRQIFEKYPNIKFHENPSTGSRVVPCGQTERHDEGNSRFSKFCKCVQQCTKDRSDVQHLYPRTLSKLLYGPYSSVLDCKPSVNFIRIYITKSKIFRTHTRCKWKNTFTLFITAVLSKCTPPQKKNLGQNNFADVYCLLCPKLTKFAHKHIEVQNDKTVRLLNQISRVVERREAVGFYGYLTATSDSYD